MQELRAAVYGGLLQWHDVSQDYSGVHCPRGRPHGDRGRYVYAA